MDTPLNAWRTEEKAWWCPGCGDFGVLAALEKALTAVGADPARTALIAGIGCSGKIGNYLNTYNLHVTHGRTLPAALGVKLANRGLTVVAAAGDGDAYAIGMGHFLHAVRRNPDLTLVVMDNRVYGLTKGQASPTAPPGFSTRAEPAGPLEAPVRPLSLAVAAGATYVAQGFSAWQPQLVRLLTGALRHPGFALVNVLSPCVTYNRLNTYDWYKAHLTDLDADPAYDPSDRGQALARLLETGELVTGLLYRDPGSVPFEERLPGFPPAPLVTQPLGMDAGRWHRLLDRFA
ncbi:MAG: thiamine pyrophosphate-dependent enzyme [Firmicutes bacterium]|nr:thiamine pyrophosphate-dependent enzyme [Bacillota bacterium]